MQSVPITTNVDTTLCDKVYEWLARGRWFSPGTPVSSTNKTDRHDWNIAESGIKHHKLNLYSEIKDLVNNKYKRRFSVHNKQ
jgi:hypothetical protein